MVQEWWSQLLPFRDVPWTSEYVVSDIWLPTPYAHLYDKLCLLHMAISFWPIRCVRIQNDPFSKFYIHIYIYIYSNIIILLFFIHCCNISICSISGYWTAQTTNKQILLRTHNLLCSPHFALLNHTFGNNLCSHRVAPYDHHLLYLFNLISSLRWLSIHQSTLYNSLTPPFVFINAAQCSPLSMTILL